MHNVWTLIQREYLERVRSRSFVIFTLLMPAFMAGKRAHPGQAGGDEFRRRAAPGAWSPTIAKLGQTVGQRTGSSTPQELHRTAMDEDAYGDPATYVIQVDTDTTEAERDSLRQQVSDGKITGFLWLTNDALAKHKVIYSTKEAADFRPVGRTAQRRTHRRHQATPGAERHSGRRGRGAADPDRPRIPCASKRAKRAPAGPRYSSLRSAW